jgi:hypothetical protein
LHLSRAHRTWIPALVLAGMAAACAAGPPAARAEPAASAWRLLEPGLELGEFASPRPSRLGDSVVRVLRIDPKFFELRLLNASAPGQGQPQSTRDWCRRNDLVAAVNASMYQTDYRKSVSLMRTRTHVNNPSLSKDKAVLGFDRLDASVPPAQIIDRECQDFEALRAHYGTLVQSIRMISCEGKNVWAPQAREWSTAAIGVDARSRVLFIHVRSPFSTHDLIDILLGLPIDLSRAMYVEGGPEAQLYVRSGGRELEFLGSYETGFKEADDNARAWPVPNVVGIARIAR